MTSRREYHRDEIPGTSLTKAGRTEAFAGLESAPSF
jgi:hypothetical protein